jgi:hypothetical protein
MCSGVRHIHAEAEAAAHALERALKDSSACVGRQERMAVATTEGYEMTSPGVVITRKAARRELNVKTRTSPLKAKEALSGPPAPGVVNVSPTSDVQYSVHPIFREGFIC